MSARKRGRRSSGRGRSGALPLKLAGVCAAAGALTSVLAVVFVVQTLSSAITSQHAEIIRRGWIIGLALAVIGALVVGLVAFMQGNAIVSRLTEFGLGLAKIGRGSAEVRIRNSGSDEISHLGRALQLLATDVAVMAREAEQTGGTGATTDPLVREMRDRTVPDDFGDLEGFEIDGALSAGTRGGMDYFDCVAKDGRGVLFLVSPEGAGTLSAVAVRMARDEILRALGAGATARKALTHTNRVLHKQLPKGACARACLLELSGDEVKLYQAGFSAPLLVCRAGTTQEVHAEGLALGLDEGPVFEKGLRSTAVPVAQGVRLVMLNDAALRLDDLVELVGEHSPKHTAPFMNLVLGTIEGDAGEGGLREDVVLLTAKRW